MAKIPPDIIEEIRSRADIVDVVGDYVPLKKRGSNFVGLCPFHNEKTPSFNVNPARGIYKCFGCDAGGDVFNFVEEVEHFSFPEAVRLIADRVGVLIPEPEELSDDASENESIHHSLRFAADYFFQNLTRTEDGKVARDYLQRRGLSSESVKTFGIGYAVNRWDGLVTQAKESLIKEDILEKAGLIIARKENEGYYDRYRGRVIFPIVSHVGKVLGFGGRVIDPEDEPKYINSPETPVYSKSRVLYGLYQARQEIRGREEVLLVEGYTDVVALHQAGIRYAVATCGTALTPDQVTLLGRYARRIILLYDADLAGVRAAVRAIDLILGSGLSAYAVALPDGEDPDSFVTGKGSEAFESYLASHREDFVHFMLSRARIAGKMDTPEGQADIQRAILRSISKIPDPLVRESYLKLASDTLDIPDMQLRSVMKGMLHGKGAAPFAARSRSQPRHIPPSTGTSAIKVRSEETTQALPEEKTLLKLMLEKGLPLVELILGNTALSDFTPGVARTMAEHLVRMYEEGRIETSQFVGGALGDDIRRLATELLTLDVEPSQNWERRRNISVPKLDDDAYEAARSAMTFLKLDRMDEAIEAQKDRIYRAEQSGEDVRNLQMEMMDLHRMKKMVTERKFITDVQ